MANLTPKPTFNPVLQIEADDFVLAGKDQGINIPLTHLANRDEWLKKAYDGLNKKLELQQGNKEISDLANEQAHDLLKAKDQAQQKEIDALKKKDKSLDQEIANLKSKDSSQDVEISKLKQKDNLQDVEINNLKRQAGNLNDKFAGYLPLTGGTLTNQLRLKNPADKFSYISLYNHDNEHLTFSNSATSSKYIGRFFHYDDATNERTCQIWIPKENGEFLTTERYKRFAATDLNTLNRDGQYHLHSYQHQDSANYPTDKSGNLQVISGGEERTNVVQIFHEHYSPRSFKRWQQEGGAWSDWVANDGIDRLVDYGTYGYVRFQSGLTFQWITYQDAPNYAWFSWAIAFKKVFAVTASGTFPGGDHSNGGVDIQYTNTKVKSANHIGFRVVGIGLT